MPLALYARIKQIEKRKKDIKCLHKNFSSSSFTPFSFIPPDNFLSAIFAHIILVLSPIYSPLLTANMTRQDEAIQQLKETAISHQQNIEAIQTTLQLHGRSLKQITRSLTKLNNKISAITPPTPQSSISSSQKKLTTKPNTNITHS